MSEFSTTRIADYSTAVANNAHLDPAITWLKTNTALSRLSNLEIFEMFQNAAANGGFVFTVNGNSVP